ncbi:MAG TPA: LamG domain-containing protein, partial [Pyrinomonadaceae bacterium]|nr:LamG domain-containing protein [Pyrinomonadaceae bacterium]
DALTGEFRSLFFEPTSINAAPVVDAGTIYFGCDDATPQANLLDGALHSVVFGQTHVLRLGLDRTGKREQQPAYASITSGDILELMGVDSCCIEAWVNTQEGGEVLSIAPTAESHYGLRLWLDQNGQINFICDDSHDDAGNNWHRLTSSASSSACDGKWHHIAVSRLGSQEVIIYLDSVALTTTTKLETIAKPSLADKLKVFIGADATATAPRNFYAGMIGEIRVWDTYLTPTRIAERMHDKLLGNEPDLLAYWNFDTLSIHDSTRFGHDGKLETSNGSSGYWLADLNFTHPVYPYLETEGRILQGGTSGDANTIFQLTVAARKADGTPLADHELTLWYVRHRGEIGPDSIEISAGTAATLPAVRPDHGADNSFKGTTGADGKAVFKIITTQVGHGPSFDVRPAFVPANERYHVNVLLDTQKLQKPAPPKLEAQAKLTQDYHWQTGDKVDHTRDRATWRTVITARNSDGRPRAGERLQLWATEHVEVEVNGRRYPINPNNYQSFVSDENGEITVALEADELRAPALSVWAGFMHRDERYTIPLDEEAHDKLGKVTGGDLAEKRKTGWRPDYNPATDDKAIVKEGYKPHAGKVATAIQHVMSVTEEPKPGMRSGLLRAKRARLHADRRNFADMLQAPPPPRADGVTSLRTLKHVERQLPLEPENFRQSLTHTLGFENSIGFVFTKSDLELRPITAVAQVHAQFLQKAPAAPKLLGNIFEDAWDAIESAAEAVWREAQKIAIYIADQVILVIEYADRIVQKVVSSIKEAIDAVVHILKMIEAFISDVIRFLMTLFDWGAILEAHKLLKQLGMQQLKEARRLVAGDKGALMKLVTGGVQPTTAQVDTSNALIASRSASTCRAENPRAHAEGHVNSVQGKYVNNKVDEGGDQIAYKSSASVTVADLPIDESSAAMAGDLATTLGRALSDPLSVSFSEMYESIKALIAGDIRRVVGQLLESALPDSDMLGKLFDALDLALNARIEIPFVSQLYKWITGEELTLLDVTCLAAAVPAHIGYTLYTLITTGNGRKLADDLRPHVTGPQSGLLRAKHEHPLALHWCYFVTSTIYTIGSGVLKAQQILKPMGEWKKGDIRFFVPMIVYTGIAGKTLLYLRGMEEEEWDQEHLIWNSTLYGTTVALDVFTLVDTFFLGDSPAGNDRLSRAKAYAKEKGKLAASVVGAGLLGIRIHAWVTHRSHQSDFYQMRDVLNAVSLMFSFVDTQMFLGNPTGKKLAPYMIAGETIVKVAASAMQMAAIQTEHGHD